MPKVRKVQFQDLVLHQDEDYTIVNKPPHLSSLEDRNDPVNLLALAKQSIEGAQVCHRLDKETSGILVIANNNEAYKHFASLLQNRQVKKVYHTVLSGKHQFQDFEADEPLYTTSNKSRVDFKVGKPSLTLVETIKIYKKHSLVKCFPVTGRMHQIRAHLAFHEASIVNDSAYGGIPAYLSELKRGYHHKKWEEETPMIGRVALHSNEIAFEDRLGGTIELGATYPKDFSVLIKQLEKYN